MFKMLLDSPGGSTRTKNKDIFCKRRHQFRVCPRCAALAILTLQLNAPSGGRGHRTSIRGGGPVTTVLRGRTLWEDVWLNVRPRSALSEFDPADDDNAPSIFPWLAPTRLSDADGTGTYPNDTHPAQIFWAMPRRLQLDEPAAMEGEHACATCGAASGQVYETYRDKAYGVNYEGPWVHPLTPYTFSDDNEPNPLKGSPSGFAYRDWKGVVANHAEANRRPASVVQYFRAERERFIDKEHSELQVRIWAFGYDADNAKIRSWHDGQIPLILVEDDEDRALLDQLATHLIDGASKAERAVHLAIKRGLYGTMKEVTSTGKRNWKYDDKASIDTSLFVQASVELWRRTEANFYAILEASRSSLRDRRSLDAGKRAWLERLKSTTTGLFDRISGYGDFHNANPKSLALARSSLRWAFLQEKGGVAGALKLMKKPEREEAHA